MLLVQNPNSFRRVIAGSHCGVDMRDEERELRPLSPHLETVLKQVRKHAINQENGAMAALILLLLCGLQV